MNFGKARLAHYAEKANNQSGTVALDSLWMDVMSNLLRRFISHPVGTNTFTSVWVANDRLSQELDGFAVFSLLPGSLLSVQVIETRRLIDALF